MDSFRDLRNDVDVDTSLLRHSGLVPGPTQTGRDLKTTTAGCFQDPEYRWGDSGTTDGGVLQPIRHPGLVPWKEPSFRTCSGTLALAGT